jgi:hypothetical protein
MLFYLFSSEELRRLFEQLDYPFELANLSTHDRLWFTKSVAPRKSINPLSLSMLLP